MARKRKTNADFGETKVIKGRIDHVTLYEVSESELIDLQKGNDSDLYLEFAIACLSTGLSFLASLVSGAFAQTPFIIFTCIVILTIIIGFILGILWYRNRKSKTKIIESIKSRVGSTDKNDSEDATTAESNAAQGRSE